jgi:hypothetical protein
VADIDYIIVICDECGERVKLKEDSNSFICPTCGHSNGRPKQIHPFSVIRKEMLERISDKESLGLDLVKWLSARDGYVCKSCKCRDGKVFTVKEIREILAGRFCESDGFMQSCRCCLSLTNRDMLAIEDKRKK